MKAVRIHHPTSPRARLFSPSNPAPPSALILDEDVPKPQPDAGQVLVSIHASTVTRDELTWPETYGPEYPILGHDLSGVVVAVGPPSSGDGNENALTLEIGDEVYGMVNATEGCTWAEFAVAPVEELARKPKVLSWAESVTVPLSGLTAWQALFQKAGFPEPDLDALQSHAICDSGSPNKPSVLVTGAAGAVGTYLVQLAALVGLRVVAASSSTARNGEYLRSLGAAEVVEYADMGSQPGVFETIIDTVGCEPLQQCWSLVSDHGALISVDSSSFDFADRPLAGKESVKAQMFIVSPSGEQLTRLSRVVELGLVKPFLAHAFPLSDAAEAYKIASGRMVRRGKVVLTI